MKACARRSALVLLGLLALSGAACDSLSGRPLGERLWRAECAGCHGVDARGNTPRFMGNPYADLTDGMWRSAGDPDSVAEVVRNGVFGQMPANPDLTREEMAALLDWFYGLRGETP